MCDWLNMSQAAKMIGISHRTLQRYVKDEKAPDHYLVGEKYKFKKSDIIDWLAKRYSGKESDLNTSDTNLVSAIYYQEKANPEQVKRIIERNPEIPSYPFKKKDDLPRYSDKKGEEKLKTERAILVLRDHAGWLDKFDAIPTGAICRKFWKISAYSGCNFWCEYCYLFKTHWNTPFSTHYVNYNKMISQLKNVDDEIDSSRVFNAGELSDPLAVESLTGWAEWTIPEIAKMNHIKLLLLTKSDSVDTLLELEHKEKTILSFSLNTEYIWQTFEHRTPHPMARILAAKNVLRQSELDIS